jgi:hypothetical protein
MRRIVSDAPIGHTDSHHSAHVGDSLLSELLHMDMMIHGAMGSFHGRQEPRGLRLERCKSVNAEAKINSLAELLRGCCIISRLPWPAMTTLIETGEVELWLKWADRRFRGNSLINIQYCRIATLANRRQYLLVNCFLPQHEKLIIRSHRRPISTRLGAQNTVLSPLFMIFSRCLVRRATNATSSPSPQQIAN